MRKSALALIFVLTCIAPAFGQQKELDREFLAAVDQRDVAKINQLLSKGANVNAREPINGYFALQYAINWPDINLVKLLLDKGANINLADDSGDTALTEVAGRGGPQNTEIAKLLIARGADVHANNEAAVFAAAKHADPEVLRLLLAKGARVDGRDKENDNNTVLMEAASGTSVWKVEMLLAAGVDIKATNDEGQTALMMAASLDHRVRPADRLPMLDLLLKRGSEINAKDKSGKTALLYSVTQYMSEAGGVISHVEIVKLLVDRGADIQVTDERGDNALNIALGVWRGDPEIPRFLIAKGINVNAPNKHGNTSLLLAVMNGNVPGVESLLEKGAAVNHKNAKGETPLMLAQTLHSNERIANASEVEKRIVALLVKAGAK